MQSVQSKTVQILPSPCDDKRVEVIIEPTAQGTEQVLLRYSTWTEGLGWCSQKTIRLDGEQLDDLHRALTVARHRLNRGRAADGQISRQSQLIKLPTVA